MKIPSRKILLTALVVPAVVLIGACGASTSDSLSAQTDGPAMAEPQSGGDDGGDSDGKGLSSSPELGPADSAYRATDTGAPADTPKAQQRAVISKGQISLRTEDIDQARFDLQKLLDTWDGSIANEQSDADDDGKTVRARLELRVPSPKFDTAMNELGDLGTLVDRSRTSEDVTTQVIDTAARVRSQRLSLDRVQALLAQARDLSQVIAIEAQLSRRQADLDSLEQQQKYLADQSSLATINVYLAVPDEDGTEDDSGFWSGLESGWDHLGSSTSALLTGTGAVLPFAVVLALLATPVWVIRRRRSTDTLPAEA